MITVGQSSSSWAQIEDNISARYIVVLVVCFPDVRSFPRHDLETRYQYTLFRIKSSFVNSKVVQ